MGHTSNSLKQLCEAIWRLEEALDLLAFRVRDVYLWQALRMHIYYRLAQATGVLEPPQKADRRLGPATKLKWILRTLDGSVRHCPLFVPDRIDSVIIESERVTTLEGDTIDYYTDAVAKQLKDEGRRVLLLDPLADGAHPKTPVRNRRYLDCFEILRRGLGSVYRPRLDDDATRSTQRIETAISDTLGVTLSLVPVFERGLAEFVIWRHLFHRFFALKRPKELYLVCGYMGMMPPAISAAKAHGIAVKELQHGTLSKYHLGYSYPNLKQKGSLAYFPDVFLAWNDFWKHRIAWPIPDDQVIAYGFPYLDRQKEAYRHVRRKPRQIVVISQGAIGGRLADILWQHIDGLDNYRIVYKLHPGEYDRWQSYESLAALSKRDNVTVVKGCDLYELFAASSIQIGVFSTALFEGMAFGLETVLVPLPGIEYMTDLVDSGDAVMLETFLSSAGAARR